MKKTLIAILTFTLTLVLAPTASATVCSDINNIGGLSHTQRQEMVIACETAKLTVSQSASVDIQDISDWGQVAKDWAEAIGIAAGELGFQANEFLGTDAGKLTAVLIAWQVLGDDIVDIISSLLVAIIAPFILLYMVRRSNPWEYAPQPVSYFWGLYTTTKMVKTGSYIDHSSHEHYKATVAIGCAVLALVEIIAIASLG